MASMNILLAEDDSDDYQFFIEALKEVSPSYCFTRATNGLECITFLKTRPKPDIVFLDLNMPLKNGLECLKFIKETEALADIPVIIYSTSHYIKHIDAAFKTGAHFYIVKPSNANLLVESLHRVITRLNETQTQPRKENFVVKSAEMLEG